MTKPKRRKLNKNIIVAFNRLHRSGRLLCRQFSQSEEAAKIGGNYIYFTVRDNVKFPTGVGRFLIENGLAISSADGLFDDTPQTFEAVDREYFEQFKSAWEAQQIGAQARREGVVGLDQQARPNASPTDQEATHV